MYALRYIPLLFLRLQPQLDMDTTDHQHTILFFDFPDRLGDQPVYRSGNLTRLQRASKGSRESTRGSCDDVIESGRMGREGVRRHFIMLGDGPVDTK
jgi:hypothetical protein